MWHRFLSQAERDERNLFAEASTEPRLRFGDPTRPSEISDGFGASSDNWESGDFCGVTRAR